MVYGTIFKDMHVAILLKNERNMQKGLAAVQVTWYNKCENVVPSRMEHENIQNGRAALLIFCRPENQNVVALQVFCRLERRL